MHPSAQQAMLNMFDTITLIEKNVVRMGVFLV